MSLAIERLQVRASVPKRLRARAPDVARLARDVIPRALAGRIAPRLPYAPHVCRIRKLRVRVRVSPRQLDDEHVASAWADAFCSALLAAIHQPPENGVAVSADSMAQWLAYAVVAALDGRSLSTWPLTEFAHHGGNGITQAVLGLARDAPDAWPLVLRALADRDALDRLARALGPRGCRELARVVGQGRRILREVHSLDDLLQVARLAVGDRSRSSGTDARDVDAMVLRLIAASAGDGDTVAWSYTPESIRSALLALWELADAWDATAGGGPQYRLRLSSDDLAGFPVLGLLVRAILQQSAEARAHDSTLRALRTALDVACPSRDPGPAASALRARRSASAGMFFLVPHLDRLGWPERIRCSAVGAEHGSRAFGYVVLGTALALAGSAASDASRVDGGLSLLAGWIDEPDLAGMRRFALGGSEASRGELLRALAGAAAGNSGTPAWDDVFRILGAVLVSEFTRRLRGFSRSRQAFIIEAMLNVPGTIDVDDRRVVVHLAPNPYWPVVSISGADATVDGVSWLGARRLEWHLEGL